MSRKRTPLRAPVFGFAGGQVLIEFGVESAARIGGELESLSISNQLQNISCAIEDRAAVVAILEVGSQRPSAELPSPHRGLRRRTERGPLAR